MKHGIFALTLIFLLTPYRDIVEMSVIFDARDLACGVVQTRKTLLCGKTRFSPGVNNVESRMKFILGYGFIVGGICFLLGFVGPIIFAPDANQGPLLGIFITGPLGFILGMVLGVVFNAKRKRDPDFKHPLRRFVN